LPQTEAHWLRVTYSPKTRQLRRYWLVITAVCVVQLALVPMLMRFDLLFIVVSLVLSFVWVGLFGAAVSFLGRPAYLLALTAPLGLVGLLLVVLAMAVVAMITFGCMIFSACP
jgi:hypothetical protein